MSAQPSRRIRVIYNPQSGMKAGLPTNRVSADEIRGLMTRYGLGDELVATESEEDAAGAAREAARAGYDVVVAAGATGRPARWPARSSAARPRSGSCRLAA